MTRSGFVRPNSREPFLPGPRRLDGVPVGFQHDPQRRQDVGIVVHAENDVLILPHAAPPECSTFAPAPALPDEPQEAFQGGLEPFPGRGAQAFREGLQHPGPHPQHVPFRRRAEAGAGDMEDLAGGDAVRRELAHVLRRDRPEVEGTLARGVGVGENDDVVLRRHRRVLDRKLVIAVHGDARQPHRLQPLRERRPQSVVRSPGIAVPDDQDPLPSHQVPTGPASRTRRSTRLPSASYTSTASGIPPSACVAQERQGS